MDKSGQEQAYAGRWVARLHGRIVAQGGTPEQASRAAQSRFKEKPEITFMPGPEPLNFSPLVHSVRDLMSERQPVYLVGGAVRDALMARSTRDLDFALEREAIKFARQVADRLKADFYPLDAERDTGRVLVANPDGSRTVMDFAAFRRPVEAPEAERDLETDLRGRDFTLNAIAVDLRDFAIYDPLGGAQDLKDKRLRACSPTAFSDDPLRILRGVRLAARFGFRLLPDTNKAMRAAAGQLDRISPERLRDELFHILECPRPAACLRSLEVLGALEEILPEVTALKGVEQTAPHVQDVWTHTLSALDHLSAILAALASVYDPEQAADLFNGLLVRQLGRYRSQLAEHLSARLTADRSVRELLSLAMLFHDLGKPAARKVDENGQLRFWDHDQIGADMAGQIARRLALSKDEIAYLERVVRNHMRIHFHTDRLLRESRPPTRRAIYRFFRDAGSEGVDLCLLALADLRATYEETLPQATWAACLEVVRGLLEAWYEKKAEQVSPPVLVDGDDLLRTFSLQPGPRLGKLIEAVREAQAIGAVSNREQALAYARKWLTDNP